MSKLGKKEGAALNTLTYQTSPRVTFATNCFVNVPIILQYDDTPLLSIICEQDIGFTTEIPIFHSDGTYLAKVKGNRVYATKDGENAGIRIREPKGMTICEMNGSTLFEITHGVGDAFKAQAELYTPTGYFVKSHDSPIPEVIRSDGETLQIGGLQMSDCLVQGCRIGIWLKSDGSCSVGCA